VDQLRQPQHRAVVAGFHHPLKSRNEIRHHCAADRHLLSFGPRQARHGINLRAQLRAPDGALDDLAHQVPARGPNPVRIVGQGHIVTTCGTTCLSYQET
jgi:hypothetical protein